MSLWPQWLRLGWLLALPLLAWAFWRLWQRRKRTGRWQALLPPAFHATLLAGGDGRATRWPWCLLGVAWLLAAVALLGPSWQRVEQLEQKPADPLVIILELTPQMLAGDVSPNRLAQARRKLMDILRARSDAQTAVVVYAGSAHTLVPLSDDLATSSNLLDALKPSLMPVPGQRADLAVGQALGLLAQAGQGQGRLVLLTTSLSDQEREGIDRRLGRQSPALLVLGLGTAAGAPVTLESGELLKDADGGIVISRLDAHSLSEAAKAHHGRYQSARIDNHDLRALGLLDTSHAMAGAAQLQSQRLDAWADQGYWLLLPLLLLAACGARRGWLFCLPLFLCLHAPRSEALEFADLWLRPDQQGQRLLESGQPGAAARRFEDHRWQGIALYRAGDYESAAERFAEGDSAADHYNRGNALAHHGDLDAAIDAYDQALERDPELKAAQLNRALVQRLLDSQAAKGGSQATQGLPGATQPAPPAQPGQPPKAPAGEQKQPDPVNSAAPPQAADAPDSEGEDSTRPPTRPSDTSLAGGLDGEQRQSLEQWLRQIPDDPSELLRRKFWYEQQQRQDNPQ